MSALQADLHAVRAARPADPHATEGAQVAVRVLARLAILDTGSRMRRSRPRRLPILGAAAAALMLAMVPWGARRSAGSASAPTPSHAQREDAAWRADVQAALGGDPLARHRVMHGGASARARLLALAEVGGPQAARALELLRAAGALRGDTEAGRVARLVRRPALTEGALRLLGRDLGAAGTRHLGRLLVEVPTLEARLVDTLIEVAASGRREPAFEALREGAMAGRRLAAAAAVRVGGAERLGRLFAGLPPGAEQDAELHAALRVAPRTTRARLARLADHGELRVLTLAARADAPGIVRRLAAEALHDDPKRAAHAVGLLAMRTDVAACLALARALDGAAHAAATNALQRASQETLARVADRARTSPRDASAALRALAVGGEAEVLADLARESRLAPAVVRALASASDPRASRVLGALATRPALRDEAVTALAARVRRGDAVAGPVLLQLARRGPARRILRLLQEGGAAARAVLDVAAADLVLRKEMRDVRGIEKTLRADRPAGAARRSRPRSI